MTRSLPIKPRVSLQQFVARQIQSRLIGRNRHLSFLSKSSLVMDKKRRATGTVSPPPLKRHKTLPNPLESKMSTFFTPASQKPLKLIAWRSVNDSMLCARYGPCDAPDRKASLPVKVAAFDLDSTLIATKSGKRFASEAADWKWWDNCVPHRLKALHEDGSRIVIFTNQGGISLKKDSKTAKSDLKRLSTFKSKVEAVLDTLNLPVSLYAASQPDVFRKPRLGMWHEMLDDLDLDQPGSIDRAKSIFVGDAGGRSKTDGRGQDDFSCSDRDFAANIDLRYYTPEEFFLKQEPRPFRRLFDPQSLLNKVALGQDSKNSVWTKAFNLELVVLCGSPGSGKSTFYWNQLKPLGYDRVNQDILKKREKCVERAAELLEAGQSVVVDNTNADVETRAIWVQLARSHNATVRCARMQADTQLCEHNNVVRALNTAMNPEKRQMLPRMAFTGFASRFREPQLEEGFEDIVDICFRFTGTDEQRALWSKYWV